MHQLALIRRVGCSVNRRSIASQWTRWALFNRAVGPRSAPTVCSVRPYSSQKEEEAARLRISVQSLIDDLASHPTPAVALDDLLRFHNDDPADKDKILLDNANDTVADLFVLVGRGIKRFMDLPYIVMMNPHMATIFKCYTDTLKILLDFVDDCDGGKDEIKWTSSHFNAITKFKMTDSKQNEKLVKVLQEILDVHTDNLVDLKDGFSEVLPLEHIDDKKFLDAHMEERILLRLLANHHLVLSDQLKQPDFDVSSVKSIGAIEMDLNVLEVLRRSYDFVNDMSSMKYADKVSMITTAVHINSDGSSTVQEIGDLDDLGEFEPLIFPYIANHIEYVLNEILKNSTRASMENKVNKPVETLVMLKDPKDSNDCYTLEIRITDHAGGIKADVVDHLFDYSFTTFDESEDDDIKTLDTTSANLIAGMGYGLPMSLTYNRLFNGDIQLETIYGSGTTVYLKWRGIQKH